MKRFLLCLLMSLLILTECGLAENIVQLPDQYLTCTANGGCQVQRQPHTEIVSLTEDVGQGIFSTFVGALSFDYPGKYTVYLVEYDTETETTYKTTVHVDVSRRDPKVDWKWDKSGNSAKTMKWIAEKGYIFTVGQQISYKNSCTIDGVEQKVVYSSNNPGVATVNENGLVTMHAPGRASILMRAEGTDEAQSWFVIVHDGEEWTTSWGDFEPEDSSETMNIYKDPDTGSKVLAVKKKWDTDNFYVISRGDGWSKVSYNGIVGYVQTGKLTFADGFEGDTPEEEIAPEINDRTEEKTEQKNETPNPSNPNHQETEKSAEKTNNKAEKRNQNSTKKKSNASLVSGPNKLDTVPEVNSISIYHGGENDSTIQLVQLGLYESTIRKKDNSSVLSVPTKELSWEMETPSTKRLASVKAPKKGSASLRKEGTTDSDIITKVKTGTLLLVMEHGKEFSKVAYGSRTGYIMNDALDFYTGNEKARNAVITNPDTRLHSGAGADYSTIGYLSYGAKVNAIKTKGNWVMVNADGYVGYVAKKYIRYQ